MRTLWIIAVSLTIAAFTAVGSALAADEPWQELKLSGEGAKDWSFVGGGWNEDAAGVIQPPQTINMVDEDLAFYTKEAYGDFEAEFEFRWDHVWTTAAFVFRARDAAHYYVVDFPAVGQQYRAEHFWGTVSKMDERNWREGLNMQMIHGVSSAPGVWHKARVVVKGDEIRVWCDGRPLSVVRDKTYAQPGFVGLASYSSLGPAPKSSFRNLRIRGQAVAPPKWDAAIQPVKNWGTVVPDMNGIPSVGCTNIVRAGNGDLWVVTKGHLWRSKDNGRTWDSGTPMPAYAQEGLLRATEDGGVEIYTTNYKPPFKIHRCRTTDGENWSPLEEMVEVKFPPGFEGFTSIGPSRLMETRDGTLLLFCYVIKDSSHKITKGRFDRSRVASPNAMNFCLRSTDKGKTWSDPIDIDGPPHDDGKWILRTEVSEVSVTLSANGDLVALVRPFSSPVMWESWSHDDGKTWTPMARGPFPLYACNNSLLTTASGTILIAGRFPGIGMQVSRDHGMSWQFHQLDHGGWANGAMFEVEPDVVLYVYGGLMTPAQLRHQLIRVTPDRVEPVPLTTPEK